MTKKHNGDFALQQVWGKGVDIFVPVLLGILVDYVKEQKGVADYSLVFVIAAVLALIATPFTFILDFQVEKNTESTWKTAKAVSHMMDVNFFFLAQLVIGFCWIFHWEFLAQYMEGQLDASNTQIGLQSLPLF